jgi:hypothetical protein
MKKIQTLADLGLKLRGASANQAGLTPADCPLFAEAELPKKDGLDPVVWAIKVEQWMQGWGVQKVRNEG